MFKAREIYCPAHFGNSYEVASAIEMKELLDEAKWWGFNAYSDWFDTIDLYNVYAPENRNKGYNLPEAIWERKFRNFQIAFDAGFELSLVITPNHVFSDQLHNARNAEKESHIFGQLLCPSDQDAKKVILANYDNIFKDFKRRGLTLKALKAAPYDYGGCCCSDCRPWIVTFGKLFKDIVELGQTYFEDLQAELIGWWWKEEDHVLFKTWADREAPGMFRALAYHVAYGEHSYDISSKPCPEGCREKTFLHIGYGEDGQALRDVYGHFGPVIAPERIKNTLAFMKTRGSEGFVAYCEGTFEDINKAILGGLSSGKFKSVNEVLEAYAKRYFGANEKEWAAWLQQWGRPFQVDLKKARTVFDKLWREACKSWRLEQLEYKLAMYEANDKVTQIDRWTAAKIKAAEEFFGLKEILWRKVWGLGITRHIFKFDWVTPPWYPDYLEAVGKQKQTILIDNLSEV